MLSLEASIAGLMFLLGTSKEKLRRFVRVLREAEPGFFNTIGKGQKAGILLRSLVNTILAHELTNGEPSLAVEAARDVGKLELVRVIVRGDGPQTGTHPATRPTAFLVVFEDVLRMAHRLVEQVGGNALLGTSGRLPPFGEMRITFGGWLGETEAELDWPEQDGSVSTYYFEIPYENEEAPAAERVKAKPYNYFSRKIVVINKYSLRAFAVLAAQAEDFNADLDVLSEPSPTNGGKGENTDHHDDKKKAVPVTSQHGLSDHPASQTQAATCDLAERSGSLPEQQASKQLLVDGSGSGSRVRAHRSAIRRSKHVSRSYEHGSHRLVASAP